MGSGRRVAGGLAAESLEKLSYVVRVIVNAGGCVLNTRGVRATRFVGLNILLLRLGWCGEGGFRGDVIQDTAETDFYYPPSFSRNLTSNFRLITVNLDRKMGKNSC